MLLKSRRGAVSGSGLKAGHAICHRRMIAAKAIGGPSAERTRWPFLTAVAASFERLVTDLTRGAPACARERVTRPGPLVFCRFYPRMATRLRAELDDTSLGRSRLQLADLDGSHGPVSGVGHDLPDPTEECWARSAESLCRTSASHPVRPVPGVHSRRCRSSALRYQLDHLMAAGAFDGGEPGKPPRTRPPSPCAEISKAQQEVLKLSRHDAPLARCAASSRSARAMARASSSEIR